MARTSRYPIELGEEERRELVRRAWTPTLAYCDVQRARMILYAAEGLPDKEIAVRCDCHPDVVSKWRRRFCEQGIEGLTDKPRTGRPRRFPPAAGRRGRRGRVRAAGQARPAAGTLLAH
ncbi:MAG: helix-turn-helix domain-containing protein [Actinobacteria bacterium]|nr:helix-turn-helix domain-containing protein [Actinomycetota bacterium]